MVVLLSDGENTSEPRPDGRGGAGRGGGGEGLPDRRSGAPRGRWWRSTASAWRPALDEDLLNGIATVTGGTYFHADDAESLREVYDTIDLKLTSEAEKTEVTGAVTGISVVLLVVGGVLSLLWFGRLV